MGSGRRKCCASGLTKTKETVGSIARGVYRRRQKMRTPWRVLSTFVCFCVTVRTRRCSTGLWVLDWCINGRRWRASLILNISISNSPGASFQSSCYLRCRICTLRDCVRCLVRSHDRCRRHRRHHLRRRSRAEASPCKRTNAWRVVVESPFTHSSPNHADIRIVTTACALAWLTVRRVHALNARNQFKTCGVW